MKKKFVILIISLCALILILNTYVIAQTTQEQQLTQEQLEAFRSAKIAQIVVEQSYGRAEGASFPFEKLTQRIIKKFAKLEVVGLDVEEFDLTIKIKARGEALSAYYLDSEARVPIYTGASLSGSIELEIQGMPPYTKTFKEVVDPERDLSAYSESEIFELINPSQAPFEHYELVISFMSKILEITGEIYGIDGIMAAQKKTSLIPEIQMSYFDTYEFQESAKEALKNMEDRAIEPLIAALNDKKKKARMFAAEVLGEIKNPRAVEHLITALGDKNHQVRVKTVEALGKIKDPRAVEHLIAALKDLNSEIRLKAIEALGKTKEPSAVELLIGALKDEEVQRSIVVVLKELTGNYFGFDQEKWHKWWEENKDTYLKKK